MGEHIGEDLKGRLKEAAGEIAGDAALKREGEIDQASAAAKKTVDSVVETVKDTLSPKHE